MVGQASAQAVSRLMTVWRLVKVRGETLNGAASVAQLLESARMSGQTLALLNDDLAPLNSPVVSLIVDSLFSEMSNQLLSCCCLLAAFKGFYLSVETVARLPRVMEKTTVDVALQGVRFYLDLFDWLLGSGLAARGGASSKQHAPLLALLVAMRAESAVDLARLPQNVAAAVARFECPPLVVIDDDTLEMTSPPTMQIRLLKNSVDDDLTTIVNAQPGFGAAILRVIEQSQGLAYNLNALDTLRRTNGLLGNLDYAKSLVGGLKGVCDMVDIRVPTSYFGLLHAVFEQLTASDRDAALAFYLDMHGDGGLPNFHDDTRFEHAFHDAARQLADGRAPSPERLHALLAWGFVLTPRNFLFELFDLCVASDRSTAPLIQALRSLPSILSLKHESQPFVFVGLSRYFARSDKISYTDARKLDNVCLLLSMLCSPSETGGAAVLDGTTVLRKVLWPRFVDNTAAATVRRGLALMIGSLLRRAGIRWRSDRSAVDEDAVSAVDCVAAAVAVHADLPPDALSQLLDALIHSMRSADARPSGADLAWLRSQLADLPWSVSVGLVSSLTYFDAEWKAKVPHCLFERLASKDFESVSCGDHDGLYCAVDAILQLSDALSQKAWERMLLGLERSAFDTDATTQAVVRAAADRLRTVRSDGSWWRLHTALDRLASALDGGARPALQSDSARHADASGRRMRIPELMLRAILARLGCVGGVDVVARQLTSAYVQTLVESTVSDLAALNRSADGRDRLPWFIAWARILHDLIELVGCALEAQSDLHNDESQSQMKVSLKTLRRAVCKFAGRSTVISNGSLLAGDSSGIPEVEGWVAPPPPTAKVLPYDFMQVSQVNGAESGVMARDCELLLRSLCASWEVVVRAPEYMPYCRVCRQRGHRTADCNRRLPRSSGRPAFAGADESVESASLNASAAHLSSVDVDSTRDESVDSGVLGYQQQARSAPDYSGASAAPRVLGSSEAVGIARSSSQDVRQLQPTAPTDRRYSQRRHNGSESADSQQQRRRPTGGGYGRGGGCYNCGLEGHVSRECPAPSRQPTKRVSSECFRCHQVGHLRRDCPIPKSDADI